MRLPFWFTRFRVALSWVFGVLLFVAFKKLSIQIGWEIVVTPIHEWLMQSLESVNLVAILAVVVEWGPAALLAGLSAWGLYWLGGLAKEPGKASQDKGETLAEQSFSAPAAIPATGPAFEIELNNEGSKRLGHYELVASIDVINMDPDNSDSCLVQIQQMSLPGPNSLNFPFELKTIRQLKQREHGRVPMSPNQRVNFPLMFRSPWRHCDWYFMEDATSTHYYSAKEIQILIAILGERASSKLLVTTTMDHGQDWRPTFLGEFVAMDYKIPKSELWVKRSQKS